MSLRPTRPDVKIVDARYQQPDDEGQQLTSRAGEGAPPSRPSRARQLVSQRANGIQLSDQTIAPSQQPELPRVGADLPTLDHVSQQRYHSSRLDRSASRRSQASFVEDESVPIPPPPYHLPSVLRQPSYYSASERRHVRQASSSEYGAPYDPSHYDQFHSGEDVELADIAFSTFHEDFAALHRVRNVSNKSASSLLPSFDAVIEVCINVPRSLYRRIDVLNDRTGRRTEQIYATAAELSSYAMVLGKLRDVLSGSLQLISLTAFENINSILLSSKKALCKIESVITTSRRTPANFFRRDRLDTSLGKAKSVRMNLECLKTSLAAITSTIILANRIEDRIAADNQKSFNASISTGSSSHKIVEEESAQIYELDSAVETIIVSLENDIIANYHAIARWQEAELTDNRPLYLNGVGTSMASSISPAARWIEGLVPPLPVKTIRRSMLPPPRSGALTLGTLEGDPSSSRVKVENAADEARIDGVIQLLLQKWTQSSTSRSSQTDTSLFKSGKEAVEMTEGTRDGKMSKDIGNDSGQEIDPATKVPSCLETHFSSVEYLNSDDASVGHLQREVDTILPEIESFGSGDEDEEDKNKHSSRLQKSKSLFSRVSSDSGDSLKLLGSPNKGRVDFQVDEEDVAGPEDILRRFVPPESHAVAFDETASLHVYNGPGTSPKSRNNDEKEELESLPKAGWEENDFMFEPTYSTDEGKDDSASSIKARSPARERREFGQYYYGSAPIRGSQQRFRSRSANGSTGFAETINDSSSEGPRSSSSRYRSGRRERSRRSRDESAGSRSSGHISPRRRPQEDEAYRTIMSNSARSKRDPQELGAEHFSAQSAKAVFHESDEVMEGIEPKPFHAFHESQTEESINNDTRDRDRSARSPGRWARDPEHNVLPTPETDTWEPEDGDWDTFNDLSKEGDFYNTKSIELSFVGEAYNGLTRDQSRLDIPPGTTRIICYIPPNSRTQINTEDDPTSDWMTFVIPPGTVKVTMHGVGGGTHETTWQRYNGVRRCKFKPDGDGPGSDTTIKALPPARSESARSTRIRGWEAVDLLALGSLVFALSVSVAAI